MVVVALLILLSPAKATTVGVTSGFFGVTNSGSTGAGSFAITVTPSATVATATVRAASSAATSGIGGGYVTTQEGFNSTAFAVGSSSSYAFVITWTVKWSGSFSTPSCTLGVSTAGVEVAFFGNVYDTSTSSYLLSSDASTTVTSAHSGCGTLWSGGQPATAYNVTFSVSLTGSIAPQYQVYTYMQTQSFVTVPSNGAGTANAAIDVGSSTNSAVCTSITYS